MCGVVDVCSQTERAPEHWVPTTKMHHISTSHSKQRRLGALIENCSPMSQALGGVAEVTVVHCEGVRVPLSSSVEERSRRVTGQSRRGRA